MRELILPDTSDTLPGFALGLFFGYPDCCAAGFPNKNSGFTYGDRLFPLRGTGFIPCEACAATKTAEQLTEEINYMRVCKLPFPSKLADIDAQCPEADDPGDVIFILDMLEERARRMINQEDVLGGQDEKQPV